eukprot:TRINITY_DN21706_c0_g1_i1.p1 TRINITY_DN21706_c0_g1~~TRINITY_DN21706_c0_g1_i1.p1  ORF type:complete len:460 (-),score=28.06 TRINITY_DN21706_c0_g1_i1:30-1307(-)
MTVNLVHRSSLFFCPKNEPIIYDESHPLYSESLDYQQRYEQYARNMSHWKKDMKYYYSQTKQYEKKQRPIFNLRDRIADTNAFIKKARERFKIDTEQLRFNTQPNRLLRILKDLHGVKDLSLVFTGLAKDIIASMPQTTPRWASLACNVAIAHMAVLESHSVDQTRKRLTEFGKSLCPKGTLREGQPVFGDVTFITPEQRLPVKEDRIALLTSLRERNRAFLQEWPLMVGVDIIVMIDFDLDQIALPQYLISTLHAMKTDKRMLLCSNGRGVADYYYDSFATVLQDNTFLYPSYIRKNQTYGPEETDWWNTTSTLLPFSEMLDRSKVDYVPVKSCFGGFAYYNASQYISRLDCGYNNTDLLPGDGRFVNREGNSCEHVNLNLCLCRPLGKCQIALKMESWWSELQPGFSIRSKYDFIPYWRRSYL